MLAMRLSIFEHLVDIGRLDEMQGIERRDGHLWIGGGTTEAAVEHQRRGRRRRPAARAATPFIGHLQIRNRGTVGGSIAHADPAAEYPAVALALDAELEATSARRPAGHRRRATSSPGCGPRRSAPHELLTGIRFPVWDGRSGFAVRGVRPPPR